MLQESKSNLDVPFSKLQVETAWRSGLIINPLLQIIIIKFERLEPCWVLQLSRMTQW